METMSLASGWIRMISREVSVDFQECPNTFQLVGIWTLAWGLLQFLPLLHQPNA